ncbi:MAG: phosphate signaling complex protein PhoU, partial [Saprospiraceae bacterium]
MLQIEHELNNMKSSLLDMWDLVIKQLENSLLAIKTGDKDMAMTVQQQEKRVNSFELSIDRMCEDFIALYQPVASDLRFVLANLKINTNLERIGDFASGISEFITDSETSYQPAMIERMQIEQMLVSAIDMVKDLKEALMYEDTKLARTIFKRDKLLDQFNDQGSTLTLQCLEEFPDYKRQALHLLSIMRKVERVGDQAKNIAEEIIFFIEAKIVKHKKKKKE